MKAVIHIGMPKAGSSAIQDFLGHNAGRLAARGVRLARAGRLEVDIPAYDYPAHVRNTVKLGRALAASTSGGMGAIVMRGRSARICGS